MPDVGCLSLNSCVQSILNPGWTMRAFLLLSSVFAVACSEAGVTKFNANPDAVITSHMDGDVVRAGEPELITGQVGDIDHDVSDLNVTWTVDDTEVCTDSEPEPDGGVSCEASFEDGGGMVVLSVSDPARAGASSNVDLMVQATDAPEVDLTAPVETGTYYADQTIAFQGMVADTEDAPEDLTVTIETDELGDLEMDLDVSSEGEVNGFGLLPEGEHAVVLRAIDRSGKEGNDSVIITVGPPNSAPTCAITAPMDGAAGTEGEEVRFEGTANDVDVPSSELTVSWESDKDGLLGESTPSSDGIIGIATSDLSPNTHRITLTVTDDLGEPCTQGIYFTVGTEADGDGDGTLPDTGIPTDTGALIDTGALMDTGPPTDTGGSPDTGHPAVSGCTEPASCNYDSSATVDDGSCYSAVWPYDCEGLCIAEIDCAGICDGAAVVDDCGECDGPGAMYDCWDGSSVCSPSDCSSEPISGCTDASACNYDSSATVDDGSCYSAEWPYDCAGSCITATDCSGVCGGSATYDACDVCDGPGATETCWDGSAVCSPSDCSSEPISGCTYASACNYDSSATVDDGSCYSAEWPYDCEGSCIAEIDCSGVCDGSATYDECDVCDGPGATETCWDGSAVCSPSDCSSEPIYGCTYASACNYDSSATVDDGSCYSAEWPYDCAGSCIATTDCAGVCGGSATYDACDVCDGPGATETCWDGSSVCSPSDCSPEPIYGCTDASACNYDGSATVDDGTCYSAEWPYDCAGSCIATTDCSGVCGGSATYDECGFCDGPGPTVICMMSPDPVCEESDCTDDPGGGEGSGGGVGGGGGGDDEGWMHHH